MASSSSSRSAVSSSSVGSQLVATSGTAVPVATSSASAERAKDSYQERKSRKPLVVGKVKGGTSRTQAMMFHPTNGRDFYKLLPMQSRSTLDTTRLSLTPAVAHVILESIRQRKSDAPNKFSGKEAEHVHQDIVKEFGLEDLQLGIAPGVSSLDALEHYLSSSL